jgi:hypothetical protein
MDEFASARPSSNPPFLYPRKTGNPSIVAIFRKPDDRFIMPCLLDRIAVRFFFPLRPRISFPASGLLLIDLLNSSIDSFFITVCSILRRY